MEALELALAQAVFPGPVNLLIGFLFVMFIYSMALMFTYWISKDE
jgi:hypothetical protein